VTDRPPAELVSQTPTDCPSRNTRRRFRIESDTTYRLVSRHIGPPLFGAVSQEVMSTCAGLNCADSAVPQAPLREIPGESPTFGSVMADSSVFQVYGVSTRRATYPPMPGRDSKTSGIVTGFVLWTGGKQERGQRQRETSAQNGTTGKGCQSICPPSSHQYAFSPAGARGSTPIDQQRIRIRSNCISLNVNRLRQRYRFFLTLR